MWFLEKCGTLKVVEEGICCFGLCGGVERLRDQGSHFRALRVCFGFAGYRMGVKGSRFIFF